MRLLLAGLLALALLIVGFVVVASWRWRSVSAAEVARLTQAGRAAPSATFSRRELDGLPPPVVRYLESALQEGRAIPRIARFEQVGTFLLKPPEGWRPFTATQTVTSRPAGFLWDARIPLGAGAAVRVRDGLVAGQGSMHASLLGLVTLMHVEGTPAITSGSLYRYLAEAAWCPTAFLPSQGVRWEPIDDRSARAFLSAGGVEVRLEVRFGADGLIETVYAPNRERETEGRLEPAPWEGRFWNYERRDGMLIPIEGEVAWILPTGRQAYWRGRVATAVYE